MTLPQPVDQTYSMYKPTVYGRDGSIRHPHGLYWILRYAKQIDHLEITSIKGTRECVLKTVMLDTFKDSHYIIQWAHEAVCLNWIKRPSFLGKKLILNGIETKGII